ncbi:MAG: hypothetical protein C0184_06110 [Chloroflexus aggregans]|uniref:Regulator of SigK n=1 Tax=Chloroflexus aggregans TaxID=152260 RepID=A0A2J6X7G0_9CHLR|nr:MAG: hypothetical protein C0184_06110 [Chloroflexus aggregans]
MEQPSEEEITELLTAYALDALDPSERTRVQRLLTERPELQQMLTELRAVADLLPHSLDRPVLPPELRQRTIDYAVGRRRRNEQGPPVVLSRRWRLLRVAWSSVTTVLFIGLVIAMVYLNSLRQELSLAIQERDRAQALAATVQASARQLATLFTSSEPIATLTGDGGQGVVFRDTTGQIVVVAALPPLPADQVYQLWLIEGETAPVSGGVFTVDVSGYGLLRLPTTSAMSGTTLAVTAEPAPGSPGPTGTILMVGKVT